MFDVLRTYYSVSRNLTANVEGILDRHMFDIDVGMEDVIAVKSVWELAEDIGLPTSLSEIGGREEDISEMASQAFVDPTLAADPRKASLDDIIELYKSIL